MPTKVIAYENEVTWQPVAALAIAEGDFVGINNLGTASLADADGTQGNAVADKAVGFAVRAAASGAKVALATKGVLDGLSSLTIGAIYYISATAGGITATRPTTNTHTVQQIGIAISATRLLVDIGPAFRYQTSGNSVVNFNS